MYMWFTRNVSFRATSVRKKEAKDPLSFFDRCPDTREEERKREKELERERESYRKKPADG